MDVYVGEGCGERDVVIDCEKKLDEMMAFYMGDNMTLHSQQSNLIKASAKGEQKMRTLPKMVRFDCTGSFPFIVVWDYLNDSQRKEIVKWLEGYLGDDFGNRLGWPGRRKPLVKEGRKFSDRKVFSPRAIGIGVCNMMSSIVSLLACPKEIEIHNHHYKVADIPYPMGQVKNLYQMYCGGKLIFTCTAQIDAFRKCKELTERDADVFAFPRGYHYCNKPDSFWEDDGIISIPKGEYVKLLTKRNALSSLEKHECFEINRKLTDEGQNDEFIDFLLELESR